MSQLHSRRISTAPVSYYSILETVINNYLRARRRSTRAIQRSVAAHPILHFCGSVIVRSLLQTGTAAAAHARCLWSQQPRTLCARVGLMRASPPLLAGCSQAYHIRAVAEAPYAACSFDVSPHPLAPGYSHIFLSFGAVPVLGRASACCELACRPEANYFPTFSSPIPRLRTPSVDDTRPSMAK